MDAIVTAGGTPLPGEPLYPNTLGKPKALLDVCGKPMVQWVMDALCASELVDRILLVGLSPDNGIICSKEILYLPDQGSLMDNVRSGVRKALELNPQADYVLSVSSDIPAITTEMVDWTIQSALTTKHEAYYNVITRQVMEARYPNSRRSYVHFKDLEVCGGDINVLGTAAVMGPKNEQVWREIIESRKNALKQASLIGWDTLFVIFFRLATLEQAAAMACKRLNLQARVVVCPYAEIGMDVDKPFQLDMVRDDLAKRVAV